MIHEHAQWDIVSIWANTPIAHVYELLEISEISELRIGSDVVIIQETPQIQALNGYYRAKRQGAAALMTTRRGVYQRMQTFANMLSPHYCISIFDAFRTIATQAELYNEFYQTIATHNPTWSDEEVVARTLLFVADPYPKQVGAVPAHNTGGAIDLSLLTKNKAEPVEFGTEIDELSDWSCTDFFETHNASELNLPEQRWQAIRRHRRILFNGMKSLGFVNLPSEWWHYDIGNAHWAETLGCLPIYASMESAATECVIAAT